MEAVTLIGLMLSLFGGVYAAMSALRSHFEPRIDQTREQARVQFEKIENRARERVRDLQKAYDAAERYYGRVRFWTGFWKKLHVVPTIFFILFSFYMAVWCLVEWDKLQMPQGWWLWKSIVYTGTILTSSACCW